MKYTVGTYRDGEDLFDAVLVSWPEVDAYLKEHPVPEYAEAKVVAEALVAAGAPEWVRRGIPWISRNGLSLICPQKQKPPAGV
jgi:hypothetical protein